MKFDFSKTLSLVKGGLTTPQQTWESYLQDCPDWKDTAVTLAGPLILANIILGVIFSHTFGGFSPFGYYSNVFSAIFWSLLLACLGLTIAVFAFNYLAGIFKGKSDFSRAFAAVSLAAIPSWVAGVVAGLIPGFIGGLITLAGGIVSLVFLYKIMPLALSIPDGKRVVHFVVSFIVMLVLNIVAATMLGGAAMPDMHSGSNTSTSSNTSSSNMGSNMGSSSTAGTQASSGIVAEMERQGQLMDSAGADSYAPPDDGKLTEKQVVAYTKVMRKTRALHEEYAQKMQKLSEEMEAREKKDEAPTMTDMSKIYGGISGAMGANNAEIEIVKTGDGNWAEHSWVKKQLRTARIQQGDGSESLAHNYKLYVKYQSEIGDI